MCVCEIRLNNAFDGSKVENKIGQKYLELKSKWNNNNIIIITDKFSLINSF